MARDNENPALARGASEKDQNQREPVSKNNNPARGTNQLTAVQTTYVSTLFAYVEAYCNLLVYRVRTGELPFTLAVEMAYQSAEWNGLVSAIGVDDVQSILAKAFMDALRGGAL